ncbi:hypothetical protein J4Q44_G00125610 [Coregonus suidteri]|uniref:Uncharacterized protein n=1 Tax=Coregonus suidteri TaxID=861788 RepID=A0AAN8MH64_9TELE
MVFAFIHSQSCGLHQKDLSLKPQECRENQENHEENQAGPPLHKKNPPRVPNGFSLDTRKAHNNHLNNHHNNHSNRHQHSDQENNNPRLAAHTNGKKKNKNSLQKKHRPVSTLFITGYTLHYLLSTQFHLSSSSVFGSLVPDLLL